MTRCFAGLDVGTQGAKAVLIDVEARSIRARAGAAYDLLPDLPPGAAEQHPRTWIDAARTVVAELLAAGGAAPAEVGAIGVSGQQHGLVVLDAADEVVRPAKLWCDTTAAAEAAELSERTGRAVPAGFTAPKMLWMKRREPDRWRRVASVLLPHDYVNFCLTGRKTMEAGDASGTGFFDVGARAFDRAAMAAIGDEVGEMVPDLLEPGAAAGDVSAEGARLFGLAEGMLVSSGSGDNMMSAVGSGATAPGVVVVSLGTSGTAFCHADRPVVDPAGLIAPFCGATGGWLPLLCVMNMTGVVEELRRGLGGGLDHEGLTRRAAEVPAGCDGLALLPYLAGERVPDLPHASGALTGIRHGNLTAAHLYRAALEGTSVSLALGVDRMRALGLTVGSVRLVGGGSKNPLWRQILSDALGVPVRRLLEPESAALGAALHALWTWRCQRGEAVGADEVAAPFIRLDDQQCEPDPAGSAALAAAKDRMRLETEALFGDHRNEAPGRPRD